MIIVLLQVLNLVNLSIFEKKEVFQLLMMFHFTLFHIEIAESYLKHPNSYLPKYNVQSETDGETTPLNGKIKNSLNVPNTFESEEELDVDDEQLNDGLFRKNF